MSHFLLKPKQYTPLHTTVKTKFNPLQHSALQLTTTQNYVSKYKNSSSAVPVKLVGIWPESPLNDYPSDGQDIKVGTNIF